ncbi:MAG: cytochrome c oxidase subunit 3 [Acidobacteria bacterium]|nr:cytochrome c oxidase subunit 3 [Acidobacteriota bacterium]
MTKNKSDMPGPGDGGNGLDGNWEGGEGDGDGQSRPERYPPPEGYRIAVRLALVSITMLFLALTSAYIFNRAKNHPIIMPQALWVSTALILISSLTMEFARRNLRRSESRFRIWIMATVLLGVGFLISQLVAWRQLVAEGFYINRNFHSGYAYLFTGLHGVHLIGGLIALGYVTMRASDKWTVVRRRVSVDITALYWHFLDGLWVYLLVLLFFWK